MNNTNNPLIAAGVRETVENAAEALSAALVLMAGKHSDLFRLLGPVLDGLENAGDDRDAIEAAAEAFSAAIVLMADGHSDLCRLLMPVLHAIEHACEAAAGQIDDATGDDNDASYTGSVIDEYNRRAALVRAGQYQ